MRRVRHRMILALCILGVIVLGFGPLAFPGVLSALGNNGPVGGVPEVRSYWWF